MKRDQAVHQDEHGRIVMGDLVLAPESESRERATKLPTKPSEDARHVLGTIVLSSAVRSDERQDYLPEPAVSWIVDIEFKGDPRLNPQTISDSFDRAWRKEYGGLAAYGRDVETGRWTFLISADGPKAVDRLKFAFDFLDVLDDDAPLPDEQLYRQRLDQIKQRLQRLGRPSVTANVSPVAAAQRSLALRDAKRQCDLTAVLILESPRGGRFKGTDIWDVMLCLGLEWGDMDCFHWKNGSENGDQSFFSVETTTPPGYFLPEEVAAERVNVEDLVFVFSVPRSAEPVAVFDAMTRAVEYCRSRLGGVICDAERHPVDFEQQRQRIIEVQNRLRLAGFEPGANATLQLF